VASGSESQLGGIASDLRGNVPGQQLGDAVDRVLGNVFEHVTQVGLWVQAVELGRADQAVHGGCAFTAGIQRRN
jgi:hypothetical protein